MFQATLHHLVHSIDNMAHLKFNVEKRLQEIYDVIESTNLPMSPSLLSGQMGIILFLAYYCNFTRDPKVHHILERKLDVLLDLISDGITLPTYGNGISGILYAITFLNENKLANIDLSDVHDVYSEYLYHQMIELLSKGNYDFLHGSLGILLYFIKNVKNDRDMNIVLDAIQVLDRIAIKDNNKIKWMSKDFSDNEIVNLSLSHGLSSIAIILSRIVKSNIELTNCSDLLRGTINYILEQGIDHKKYGSYFSSYAIESINNNVLKSRLAWCYGDLGIALALWRAGKALNEVHWTTKAIEILRFSCTRKMPQSTGVNDACICHGTAGVAQIYKRLYLETQIPEFDNTYKYWINETIQMASYENNKATYKFWKGNKIGWSKDLSLINGIAGIGLVLMSYLNEDLKFTAWDELILVS